MRRALLLLCLGAVAGAEERAFLETVTPRTAYFVHEPFRLKLRIGFDREFFATNAVQMFSRELDAPVKVDAPWLDDLGGIVLRDNEDEGADAGSRLTLALNDAIVAARRGEDRLRGGRTYTVLEIVRDYVPVAPGKLALAAPRLHFAYATEFKEDFVHGRLALDRRDSVVVGEPLTLRILELPQEGRPPEFTGAVGRRFSVRAEATPRAVAVGAVFKLVLHIEGDGQLGFFDPPRLDDLTGRFHVYGVIDDKGTRRRTITYDMAPLDAAVTEVPGIAFAYFDPQAPPAFRTLRTAPVPLTVTGDSRRTEAPAEAESPRDGVLALLVVLLATAVALILWRRARRRGTPPPDAATTFRTHAGSDLASALTRYLAARLQCPPAAVIGPDLNARLTAAGVPEALAARAATLLEELVAARYGGLAPDHRTQTRARALVEELEASFDRVA